jgi:hypothetical protein
VRKNRESSSQTTKSYLLGHTSMMKNMCLHDASIQYNFHRNQFINEGARKEGLKSGTHMLPEFFVKYKRTHS